MHRGRFRVPPGRLLGSRRRCGARAGDGGSYGNYIRIGTLIQRPTRTNGVCEGVTKGTCGR
jgi:hypothetical protein